MSQALKRRLPENVYKSLPRNAKNPLPVDVRRSKTSLLKLTNIAMQLPDTKLNADEEFAYTAISRKVVEKYARDNPER